MSDEKGSLQQGGKPAPSDDHGGMEEGGCNMGGIVTFACGLVFGTFSALLCKMAYDTESEGLDGETKLFDKPITMLLAMFVAQTPALIFWGVAMLFKPAAERDEVPRSTLVALVVPALCDLLCTALLLIAQLYISASLWQMLRGSVIVITAILKRFVLKRKLKRYMWAGVGIIACAMVLVACTSLLEPSEDSGGKDPRVGVVLVLVGCMAQGVQYVFEERVLSVDGAPPLVVIGVEGIWGTVLTLAVVYPLAYAAPGADHGSFEDPFDSIAMIQNSKMLQVLIILFMVTVTGYNSMAVYVTKYLSSIWHAVLDNFRPLGIWGLDLLLFYAIFPNQGFGEAWTQASYMQLGGLFVLFLGTAVYNGSMCTCGDEGYDEVDEFEDDEELMMGSSFIKTPKGMSSPALMRSPLLRKTNEGH